MFINADDATKTVSASSNNDIEASAFVRLSILKQFFKENNLILNPSKTNYIEFNLYNVVCIQ